MPTEFMPGVVRGIRSWSINSTGELTGRSIIVPWAPGENVARCNAFIPFFTRPTKLGVLGALGHNHRAPDPMCDCGYHAYFGDALRQATGPYIGIIEAYGKTLIASEGFRAEKAKILALASDADVFPALYLVPSLVRQNYPDVAFFNDVEKMKLEFPPNKASDFIRKEGS